MSIKKAGTELCSLPDVHGFFHSVFCIKYFSAYGTRQSQLWIRGYNYCSVFKRANLEAWRKVCKWNNLHCETGAEEDTTDAYHPEATDLEGRKNRTI